MSNLFTETSNLIILKMLLHNMFDCQNIIIYTYSYNRASQIDSQIFDMCLQRIRRKEETEEQKYQMHQLCKNYSLNNKKSKQITTFSYGGLVLKLYHSSVILIIILLYHIIINIKLSFRKILKSGQDHRQRPLSKKQIQ